jgi:hypothetical protein
VICILYGTAALPCTAENADKAFRRDGQRTRAPDASLSWMGLSLSLSALILLYFSILKRIFYPDQRDSLLYPTILRGHNYPIYLLYTNYHLLYHIFTILYTNSITRLLYCFRLLLLYRFPGPTSSAGRERWQSATFGVEEAERERRVRYRVRRCRACLL